MVEDTPQLGVGLEFDPVAGWEREDAGEGSGEDWVLCCGDEEPDFGLCRVSAKWKAAATVVCGGDRLDGIAIDEEGVDLAAIGCMEDQVVVEDLGCQWWRCTGEFGGVWSIALTEGIGCCCSDFLAG